MARLILIAFLLLHEALLGFSCSNLFNQEPEIKTSSDFTHLFKFNPNHSLADNLLKNHLPLTYPHDHLMVMSLQEILDGTSELNLNEIIEIIKDTRARGRVLKEKADLSDYIEFELRSKSLFEENKENIFRALNEGEMMEILKNGYLDRGRYFSARGLRPLIGFNGSYLYINCRNCSEEWFFPGENGTGVITATNIPLEYLEAWLPILE